MACNNAVCHGPMSRAGLYVIVVTKGIKLATKALTQRLGLIQGRSRFSVCDIVGWQGQPRTGQGYHKGIKAIRGYHRSIKDITGYQGLWRSSTKGI